MKSAETGVLLSKSELTEDQWKWVSQMYKQGVSIQVQISLTEIQWFPQQPANHVCLSGWLTI